MPDMISLRSFRLASKSGHTLQFEANKPRFVPDAVTLEAMAAGCVRVDGEGQPVNDDTPRGNVALAGTIRQSVLYLFLKRTRKENKVANFDAGGVPKLDVINRATGLDVGGAERTDAWRRLLSDEANGEAPDLHPNAQIALDVIDAESKAELLLVAKENSVPEELVSGLAARDLRKLLLERFMGA